MSGWVREWMGEGVERVRESRMELVSPRVKEGMGDECVRESMRK